MQQTRQTAYKVWIANLLNGQYTQQPGEWEPNYILCNNYKISRVNMLATVIGVDFGENYGSITLDDGSATIQVRAFKEDVGLLRGITIGDILTVIGRPREFQSIIYIIPEIVRKVTNPAWITVRRKEIQRLFGEPERLQQKQPQQVMTQQETGQIAVTTEQATGNAAIYQQSKEEVATTGSESGRQRILNLVEKAGETGMEIGALLLQANLEEKEAESIINELLKDGEIYTPRPGQVKIV